MEDIEETWGELCGIYWCLEESDAAPSRVACLKYSNMMQPFMLETVHFFVSAFDLASPMVCFAPAYGGIRAAYSFQLSSTRLQMSPRKQTGPDGMGPSSLNGSSKWWMVFLDLIGSHWNQFRDRASVTSKLGPKLGFRELCTASQATSRNKMLPDCFTNNVDRTRRMTPNLLLPNSFWLQDFDWDPGRSLALASLSGHLVLCSGSCQGLVIWMGGWPHSSPWESGLSWDFLRLEFNKLSDHRRFGNTTTNEVKDSMLKCLKYLEVFNGYCKPFESYLGLRDFTD